MKNVTRRGTLAGGLLATLSLPGAGARAQAVRSAPRLATLGLDPWFEAGPVDAGNGAALQSAFDGLGKADSLTPTVRLPHGNWSIGSAVLSLKELRSNLIGQGISITYLHTTVAPGQTALTLRNYGGITRDFGLDSGPPGMAPEMARRSVRNGILFDWSGGHGSIGSIETRWFNGFGMRFVNVWDTVIENVITVGCGNADEYAIAFVAAGDTTNHTNVNRLQAEDSVGRAILVDETCMNMCIDNIHCEGTIGRRGTYAISLRGSSMSYRNARVANDGGNVDVLLGGAGNVYDRFSFEDGVIADYATGEIGDSKRSFITHSTFDRLRILSRNRGALVIEDCTIAQVEIADQAGSITFVRCIVGDVTVTGNQTDVTFDDCRVDGQWKSAGNATVRARDCRMRDCPSAPTVHLADCTIRQPVRSLFNQQIHTVDCTFESDVVLDNNGARIWLSGKFTVGGALGYSAGAAFGACSLEGTVEGAVHPNWYGTDGTWPRNTLRARPDAGRGAVPYTRFDGVSWSAAPVLL